MICHGIIGQAHLNSKATMEAVRNENACNPIIQSATKSYLRVAQRCVLSLLRVCKCHDSTYTCRLEPSQLEKAKQDYQLEKAQQDYQLEISQNLISNSLN